jgi:hypothetical protein
MKSLPLRIHFPLAAIICALLLPLCGAWAAPVPISPGFLQPPQVTFSEVPAGTALNGLSINGFTFTENLATAFTAPPGGPGNTNNIAGAYALSGVPPGAGYILSIALLNPARSFGFGFSLQGGASGPNAVMITLFNGATNLGFLTFAGNPDPNFIGGFAALGNDAFFNRVEITFDPSFTGFAVDNFAANSQVPEGRSMFLMLLGGLLLWAFSRYGGSATFKGAKQRLRLGR